nr:MAG TPA: hypothetical protein [Caudoviricetes sp.]
MLPTQRRLHIRRCMYIFRAEILYHLRAAIASGTFVPAGCYFYTHF